MKHAKILLLLVIGGLCSQVTAAQLLEQPKVDEGDNVDAPGGTIGKSLLDQIGAGHGDVDLPGSAVYLIKRDPARSIRRGRQLFQRKFSADEGLGPRVNFTSSGDVTQNRALGAGLADSCAACHGRPRGSAGFGGDVATRPDSRDAPHLFGLGLVEQLADEMTQELRAVRAQAIAEATGGGTCDPSPGNPPPWSSDGVVYDVGSEVTFNDKDYQAIQAHVSQPGWDPVSTPALWNRVMPIGTCPWEIQVPYVVGSLAIYNGVTYEAIQAHTSQVGWQPPDTPALWQVGGGGGGPVTAPLIAKGIDFGSITAHPDGSVDTANVEGVNPDLRIRPFFAQGGTVTIREFIVGALKDEMGLQAFDPVLCAVTDPVAPQTMVSPAGFEFDPSEDEFERPPACDTSEDGDGDGISNEIDAALVDHMEFYLLNYFKPGRYRVTQRTQQGRQLMEVIGCTSCHTPDLVIDVDRRVADVETAYDPDQGIFNQLFATASTLFDVVEDGDPYPLLLPQGQSFTVTNFFSDLKRHDLGSAFHEREYDGGPMVTEFVTEPLWGVGSSAPYGHDGRSINLDQVIRRHGGEAHPARQGYLALNGNDRRKILEFLQSLVLFPPDDTASNLNPGNPGTNNPQDPAEHGTINLGALFQIPEEGTE